MGHVFFVVAMTAVGFAIIYVLNAVIDKKTNPQVKHIDKNHPKTADQLSELIHSDHYDEHKKEYEENKSQRSLSQLFIAGLVMAFAIALHNFPEGMVIVASYASDELTGGVGGLAMAIVIGLHNIPEGMAVSVPLVAGGMHKVKATLLTALTGAPTILGAMLGYFLGTLSPVMLALSLSFASGPCCTWYSANCCRRPFSCGVQRRRFLPCSPEFSSASLFCLCSRRQAVCFGRMG